MSRLDDHGQSPEPIPLDFEAIAAVLDAAQPAETAILAPRPTAPKPVPLDLAAIAASLDGARPVEPGVLTGARPAAPSAASPVPVPLDFAAIAASLDGAFTPPGFGNPVVDRGDPTDVETLNKEFAVVLVGQRAAILRERPKGAPGFERHQLLSVEGFEQWMANRTLVRRDGKEAPAAKAWLKDPLRRQYEGLAFEPDPSADLAPAGYYNLWRGFDVKPRAGDCSCFLDHLLENVCGGSTELHHWVLGWLAQMVQSPRERLGTALVLRGGMGTGKTIVGKTIGSLFSAHYFLVDEPRYLTGQFNAHMGSCLLLQADEGFWAGDKAAEGRLKGLITAEAQMIEHKGVDPIRVANYVRLLVTSNEEWVVPAGKDERRFAVIDVGNKRSGDHGYFAEIEREMANGGREALLAELLSFKLDGLNLREIPRTRGLYEQKVRSLEPVESWWLERLREGAQLPGESWQEWVATPRLFGAYCATADKVGVRRKGDETSFGMRLNKLVPGLRSRRVAAAREDAPDVLQRQRGYVFPPLAECRVAFAAALKHDVDWEE